MQNAPNMIPLQALVVEDSEDDTLLLVRELTRGGYDVNYHRVDTYDTMSTALSRRAWDIVFADFTMPRFSAFEALKLLRESGQDLPFIIVSGTIGEDRAVAAMKAGAHDYILKQNLKRLLPAIERELREAHIREERRQAEKKIRRLAFFDSLTQLPNRAQFLELVQQALVAALGEHRQLALLLMDIDQFKEVNDTLGHTFGDALLVQISARLRSVLFEADVIARLGGDEFGILLPRIRAPEDIQVVLQKLAEALVAPFMIEGVADCRRGQRWRGARAPTCPGRRRPAATRRRGHVPRQTDRQRARHIRPGAGPAQPATPGPAGRAAPRD
ncbi:MAG: diguanylate cyclase [Gammaproteobacteria bacterium]|nr:diguanylate cyclase [Gammaproteobacteria bacterium]